MKRSYPSVEAGSQEQVGDGMRKLTCYTGEDFYGIDLSAEVVPALHCEVQHGLKHGQPYSYILFSDAQGIKWKILPTQWGKHGKARGRPAFLRLYHRNTWGPRGFHSQREGAWGTSGGIRDLIATIRRHEAFECEEGN